MKKLVFVFAAIVALTFAACGNNTASGTTSDSATVDSTVDTVVVDTVATVTADSID